MARSQFLARVRLLAGTALAIALLCGLEMSAEAQTTVTVTNPTTPCVQTIRKFYFPSGPPSTTAIGVFKYLTAPRNCVPAATVSAFCGANPGTAAATDLSAQATSAQLLGTPSCQWNCTGPCGTIVTNGATDGLPVELMDFEVGDEDRPVTEDDARETQSEPEGR